MDKICEMKKTLENYVCTKVCGDLESTDTKELGEAIDMIKDLAEAMYYCKATEAMEGAGEELSMYDARMGYNTSRYNNGRYAPSGSGHYSNTGNTMGYMPMEKDYLDGYIHDPVRFRESMRMGYRDSNMTEPNRHGSAYMDWSNARRHYTETHSTSDKQEMNTHTHEHISDVMVTIKEMWNEADPNLRTEMKSKLQQLFNELN